MLPFSYRLPAQEITPVMKAGRRIQGNGISMIYKKLNSGSPQLGAEQASAGMTGSARFAFIVGVKVDKRAVGRNRVKRLLRESVHHLLPLIKPGWDVVIVAKKELVGKSQAEVEAVVQEVLQKAQLI